MSMSTHVYGIKPPDEKWLKMKAVYDACEKAGVDYPSEILKFFGGENPDEKGVVVDITKLRCCAIHSADMESGYEIDLTKLPADIKIVRFVNSR